LISPYYPKAAEVKEQPKAAERQEQTTFFDLPIHKPEPVQKWKRIKWFELTNETREIVNQPVQFVPVLNYQTKELSNILKSMEVEDTYNSKPPKVVEEDLLS
jgi:cell division protein FtsZ